MRRKRHRKQPAACSEEDVWLDGYFTDIHPPPASSGVTFVLPSSCSNGKDKWNRWMSDGKKMFFSEKSHFPLIYSWYMSGKSLRRRCNTAHSGIGYFSTRVVRCETQNETLATSACLQLNALTFLLRCEKCAGLRWASLQASNDWYMMAGTGKMLSDCGIQMGQRLNDYFVLDREQPPQRRGWKTRRLRFATHERSSIIEGFEPKMLHIHWKVCAALNPSVSISQMTQAWQTHLFCDSADFGFTFRPAVIFWCCQCLLIYLAPTWALRSKTLAVGTWFSGDGPSRLQGNQNGEALTGSISEDFAWGLNHNFAMNQGNPEKKKQKIQTLTYKRLRLI